MDIIHKNPFRVLGLNANSTERELQKQIAKVKRYLEVGKSVTFPTDYPFLREIDRPIAAINQATSQIEQSYQKLFYALFWFVNETTFDEIAHTKLQENDVASAIEIWNKKLKSEVTDSNFSAYLNLSSLFCALSFDGSRIDNKMLSKGLLLKGRLLGSSSLSKLTDLLHIKSDNVNSSELTSQFVDETLQWLTPFIAKPHGIKSSEVIPLFSSFPEHINKQLADKFTEEPVRKIESRINKCEEQRQSHPLIANKYGEDLYASSRDWLDSLCNITGKDDVKYKLLTNKLAEELLQCSIDYFNAQLEEENYDPHRDALLVLGLAEKVGATGRVANRLKENRDTLEELLEERDQEKQAEQLISSVKANILNVTSALESFRYETPSVGAASQFISTCKRELDLIGGEIGDSDETYKKFCDAVVTSALNMLIDVVNRMQENPKHYGIDGLLAAFTKAKSLTRSLLDFNCSYEVKLRVRENLQTISDVTATLQNLKQKNSGGCYIATMAYGSYEHPQVMKLRHFRDTVLRTTWYGNLFIKIYYKCSPYLVSLLSDHDKLNKQIRKLLDKFIRKIEK